MYFIDDLEVVRFSNFKIIIMLGLVVYVVVDGVVLGVVVFIL